MPRLIWDAISEKEYEQGVDRGVLYPQNTAGQYPLGVAWNGLTGVTEAPTGAEPNPKYADNIKYANLYSVEEFGATIEAFTYPPEFELCDGTAEIAPGITIGQQARRAFGLSYRTLIGNDTEGSDYGYKLHLIYGGMASPSDKGYQTINDSPDLITFSWEITTTPIQVEGFKPTASLTVNSTKVQPSQLATLEDILYGTADAAPRLPLPAEVAEIFAGATGALELVSIVPDDDATDVDLEASIVLTFNNEIATEAIVITKADGTIVPGSKTWDLANKILTFNPTTGLGSGSVYLVTVAGVVDIYGQILAPAVNNFMTVA